MLIDKGITSGEVVTLKLSTGEEVLAKFISDDGDFYELSKPLVLTMTPKGIGMMPFTFTVNPDKNIKINKKLVIFISTTDREYADQYLQGTTGIALR